MLLPWHAILRRLTFAWVEFRIVVQCCASFVLLLVLWNFGLCSKLCSKLCSILCFGISDCAPMLCTFCALPCAPVFRIVLQIVLEFTIHFVLWNFGLCALILCSWISPVHSGKRKKQSRVEVREPSEKPRISAPLELAWCLNLWLVISSVPADPQKLGSQGAVTFLSRKSWKNQSGRGCDRKKMEGQREGEEGRGREMKGSGKGGRQEEGLKGE